MKKIELFVQGEGVKGVALVEVAAESSIKELLHGVVRDIGEVINLDTTMVFLEGEDSPLHLDYSLDEAKIEHRSRIHLHQCHQITVSVFYNGKEVESSFSPATTIKHIHQWAIKEFGMAKENATEYALEIVDSDIRPDSDVHVGSLVAHPKCSIAFDFVAKKRVEG